MEVSSLLMLVYEHALIYIQCGAGLLLWLLICVYCTM